MKTEMTLEKFENTVVEIEKKRLVDHRNIEHNAMLEITRAFNGLSPDDQMEVRRRQNEALDKAFREKEGLIKTSPLVQ